MIVMGEDGEEYELIEDDEDFDLDDLTYEDRLEMLERLIAEEMEEQQEQAQVSAFEHQILSEIGLVQQRTGRELTSKEIDALYQQAVEFGEAPTAAADRIVQKVDMSNDSSRLDYVKAIAEDEMAAQDPETDDSGSLIADDGEA
jgi:hypothetical protein